MGDAGCDGSGGATVDKWGRLLHDSVEYGFVFIGGPGVAAKL